MLYALILAIGREPLPGAETRAQIPQLARPASPERLAPIPGIERSRIPTVEGSVSDRVTVPIQIQNVPAFLGGDAAGIATFHSLTGSDFRWLPLSEAIPGQDGSLLVTSDAQTGTQLTVTLAAKREDARHGYIARQVIDVVALNGRSTEIVTVQASVHEVQFNLPVNIERAGPLRLQRMDDPQWLPVQYDSTGLSLQRGQETSLKLSAGTYELRDPLKPERSQQFTVPDATTVEISADLAPAQDDRL